SSAAAVAGRPRWPVSWAGGKGTSHDDRATHTGRPTGRTGYRQSDPVLALAGRPFLGPRRGPTRGVADPDAHQRAGKSACPRIVDPDPVDPVAVRARPEYGADPRRDRRRGRRGCGRSRVESLANS